MASEAKYTKAVAKEICDWLEKDRSLADLQKSDPARYPAPATVWRWMKEYPDFKEMMVESRMIQAFSYNEKLTELEANPPEPSGDLTTDKYNMRVWDMKIRVVQFKLLKMAKIFDSKVFSDKQSIEIENKGGPQIVIMDYATAAVVKKETTDSTTDPLH